MNLRIYTAIIFFTFCWSNSFGQLGSPFGNSRLYSLQTTLAKGDKNSLGKLAPYLDSTTSMLTEQYDMGPEPEQLITERIIYDNCIFTQSEIADIDKMSARDFLNFLNKYNNKLHFDSSIGAFLITPLTEMTASFQIRALTEGVKNELENKQTSLLNNIWIRQNKVDSLIRNRNPLALLKIASEFYKERNGYSRDGQIQDEECIDLIELLTGTEIGVEDNNHKIDYFIESDVYAYSRLNLLIYFARNYQSYHWDDASGVFYNSNADIKPVGIEMEYFQLLNSKVDSVAINAFIKLTTCDTGRVSAIADKFERANIEKNYAIPTFPYRFLEQITVFTAYCKANQINLSGSKSLIQDVNTLKEDLPFSTRRRLEDKMIKTLSPDDISAFEYWCLVYEKKINLTYSAGRILDAYYSNHWQSIVGNRKQLEIYLKKSFLFHRLGIIGICNNYLMKFTNANAFTLNKLENVTSKDQDIVVQKNLAIQVARQKSVQQEPVKKTFEGNYDSKVKDLKNEFLTIVKSYTEQGKRDEKISELFSKINYEQIGLAMTLIDDYKFKYAMQKWSFIESDFGFFMGDFEDPKFRKEFLAYYSAHTEKELYAHYLAIAQIDYLNANGTMNYDKIYELLKYDEAVAFVGGGGGVTRQNEVYSLIKLLELKFHTTLGFPRKLCNSDNTWGCDSSDRKKAWMDYLRENNLLKLQHNTPLSFSF